MEEVEHVLFSYVKVQSPAIPPIWRTAHERGTARKRGTLNRTWVQQKKKKKRYDLVWFKSKDEQTK